MGVRVLVGTYDGTEEGKAVLIDSVSGTAFGPLLDSYEEAEALIAAAPRDLRALSENALLSLRRSLQGAQASSVGDDTHDTAGEQAPEPPESQDGSGSEAAPAEEEAPEQPDEAEIPAEPVEPTPTPEELDQANAPTEEAAPEAPPEGEQQP